MLKSKRFIENFKIFAKRKEIIFAGINVRDLPRIIFSVELISLNFPKIRENREDFFPLKFLPLGYIHEN